LDFAGPDPAFRIKVDPDAQGRQRCRGLLSHFWFASVFR
jgi:hypothetical protein